MWWWQNSCLGLDLHGNRDAWIGMPSMLHDHEFAVGLLLWRSLHSFSIMKGSYTLCNEWGGRLSLNGFPSVKPPFLSWGTPPPHSPAVVSVLPMLAFYFALFLLILSVRCWVRLVRFLRSGVGGRKRGVVPSEINCKIGVLISGSLIKVPPTPPIKARFFLQRDLADCWVSLLFIQLLVFFSWITSVLYKTLSYSIVK